MLNNFYTIAGYSVQDGRIDAAIRIDPEHSIFAGHFPGQPVVPGVCMVQIIKDFMRQFLEGKDILLSQGHQFKFLQLIVPCREDLVRVELNIEEKPAGYSVLAVFKKEDQALFKMTGTFILLPSS